MQDATTIAAAIPAPSRPFETFPTPGELAGTRLRMAGLAYLHTHCGVSPADGAAWRAYAEGHHFEALCWGMLALLNQYELARGLPERWPREAVFDMPPEQLMSYFTEARALVASTAPESTEDAAATRPTVASPQARPRGKRTGTRQSSPTASITNTDGAPATS